MEQRWIFPEKANREKLLKMEEELHMPAIVAQILLNRHVDSFEKARRFLRPSLDDLRDPFLMADMDRAVDRLSLAISRKEQVVIHGDYDVDGVSGASFLVLVLRELGVPVSFYIPHRITEGYGLSLPGIREIYEQGTQLIISVDCGITAIEPIGEAARLGMDVIVTDHHQPKSQLPEACAVLDPKRDDCPYPFKELAGAGVAFKLAQGLFDRLGWDPAPIYKHLDLVALGSAADIVPLVDENRVLVKFGLEQMAQTENLGLKALLENVGLLGKPLGTGQIVFQLAPRVNAVGRMGSAQKAVRLLTTDSEGQAKNIAQILESENRLRKQVDERTLAEALKMAEETLSEDDRVIVLAAEGWHQGVIGIVASRIVERFYLPTVLISLDGSMGKGSARSIPGFNLYEALHACQDVLEAFGGHRYAAGLTIRRDRVEAFHEKLQSVAKARLTDDMRIPYFRVDGEIPLGHINERLVQLLGYLAPFGPQNMKPVLVSRGLEVVGTPTVVGTDHLKFRVRQEGHLFDCIGFGMAELLYRATPGETNLDMAYVIEENEWMGRKKIQLRVKDLR
ncbi:MAG: single-stranded-DNA-specific exonuclease RecJ [Candidatus Latescibacterota bacterium]